MSSNTVAPLVTYTTIPAAGIDQAVPGGIGNLVTSETLNQIVVFNLMGMGVTFGAIVTLILGLVALTVLILNSVKLINILKCSIEEVKNAKKSITGTGETTDESKTS